MTDNRITVNDIIVWLPVITILPLIIGIFYKIGYLVPFDLQFLISSFSYTELALSSYSAILYGLTSLLAFAIIKDESLPRFPIWSILGINTAFIVTHYTSPFNLTFINLLETLTFINAFLLFSFNKGIVIRMICIFALLVVSPALTGLNKYWEFPKEASQRVVLKNDSTEWYLVDKVADTLVLVDKKSLQDKNYVFKFVDIKEIDKMDSELWPNVKKAP